MRGAATALALAALLLPAGGCGDGADDAPPEPPPPPPETIDRVRELPDRWKVRANRPGGFAFGLPPGWRARNRGISTLVRSFDRLVAVSISPDRTDEAIEVPLADFVTRALVALPGFEAELAPQGQGRFQHRYRGIEARAAGTATRSGIRQRVRVIVLRRDRLVTFTIVIAANVEGGRASERVAERMVRTLRSRPVARRPSRPR